MIKRLTLSIMLVLSFIGLRAQDAMNPELPLNPKVLHGTLSNGLNYYIMHNEEPKNRANFYIAQKVGSSLETPDQLGLAHFLEHMAFNGTTHYPGNSMLDYLQTKGIRFGADINAYTNFDETVYNINNVPTTDQALMDSVLLVLADWSGSILLEEDEIDAERGVIEGEYISRNDADIRMYTAILPQLYEEYQYQQMPIGKMEIIKNFKPQVLRDYYKKWYRPDLQGIVIVGDFDAMQMEEKVKTLFSQIEMPANAAERIYPTISDNEKPIFVTFEDPELQMPSIITHFKFDRLPFELRNTNAGYITDIVSAMVASMINNRLNEYAQKPDCPYSYAGVNVGKYMVSSQKGDFYVVIIPKDDYVTAFDAAMGIVARACKTGFMGTEVQRVRDELLAGVEAQYNERDKTDSNTLAREIIRHFVDNEPAPGIEFEHEMLSQFLPMLPEAVFNQLAAELLHIDNVAVVISQPTTVGLNIPAENELISQLNNIIDADYEPYVDEVITEPLISELPQAGKIVSEKDNASLGTKEIMLSNGVKVVIKSTDFANDEVLLEMFKPGGKSAYPSNEAFNVMGLDLLLEVSKVGPFTPTRLEKYLAGKKVNLNYNLGNSNNIFNGYSTVKDVQTLFELLYASFTNVSEDQETYDATMAQIKTFLANQESNPEYQFNVKRNQILYPNSPVLYPLSIEALNGMDYGKIMNLYKQSVNNAADYTLVLTGNIDVNTIKPLLEQYVATLPSLGKKSANPAMLTSIVPVAGKKTETFNIPSQSPSVYVFDCISQSGLAYNNKNDIMIDFTGKILSMIFTETLREEMGGTYSPSAFASFNPYTSTWTINWYVVTNEEMQKAIIDRANQEFNKLVKEGTDAQHFNKVKEAAIKKYENDERSNNFWLNSLLMVERGFNTISGYKADLESITLDEYNKFVKKLYNGKNKIEVVGIAK